MNLKLVGKKKGTNIIRLKLKWMRKSNGLSQMIIKDPNSFSFDYLLSFSKRVIKHIIYKWLYQITK